MRIVKEEQTKLGQVDIAEIEFDFRSRDERIKRNAYDCLRIALRLNYKKISKFIKTGKDIAYLRKEKDTYNKTMSELK